MMEFVDQKNETACPLPEISAYLDGELSSSDELELEMHMTGCRVCADDLNLQKSFLNALDFSLEDQRKLELPKNFTKAVVANAESRVSGLRRPHERRNAALICGALIMFSLFALGSNGDKTIANTMAIFDKIFAVVLSAGHMVYGIALGSAIVFRSLASKFVFESGAAIAILFVLVFLVVSLYSFSRLLLRFHRT